MGVQCGVQQGGGSPVPSPTAVGPQRVSPIPVYPLGIPVGWVTGGQQGTGWGGPIPPEWGQQFQPLPPLHLLLTAVLIPTPAAPSIFKTLLLAPAHHLFMGHVWSAAFTEPLGCGNVGIPGRPPARSWCQRGEIPARPRCQGGNSLVPHLSHGPPAVGAPPGPAC